MTLLAMARNVFGAISHCLPYPFQLRRLAQIAHVALPFFSPGGAYNPLFDLFRRGPNEIIESEADKLTGRYVDLQLGKQTLGAFADEWFGATLALKPSTRASYGTMLGRYIRPAFGTTPLTAVTRTGVRNG